MRFSASLFFTVLPILSSVLVSVHAAPAGVDLDGIECYPSSTQLKRRDFHDDLLEGRGPVLKATTLAFITWLKKNPSNMAPVFWTGKNGRRGAKGAADVLKNNKAIVGPAGGHTVFDAVAKSGIKTADWTIGEDWSEACGAFAATAQPGEKKAFLVYGKEVAPVLNIWKNKEWPNLEGNPHVEDVETYLMEDDGKVEFQQEIKRSKRGNTIGKK
ncbi:hypothetical protein C0991_008695 [Blastosporella zonata]|nr:hypothetical protein C0991_008695 [Blastosporella zonata]